jgi:signal transduction histidine kinase
VFERRKRRIAEAESRRHLVAMAHLDRRHSMGELTASISHELNQPLGAILRNAEAASMLLSGPQPPLGELREIVEDIRKDDRRAGEVVRRLRVLLCDHKLEVEPVDMKEVAEEAAAVVAPDAHIKGVRVDLELADGTTVAGDRIHLQQVLLNIMINALDAMAEVPVDARRMVVRTARSNGSVAVSVKDSGPGLVAGNEAQIFEAFYTTKGTGMGMGLSVARSIVEAHGGQITAENNPGGGACIQFVLPGHAGAASRP